ncbi:hypothetical protein [Rickettsiella endosymbiont of Xylota segnis]|uniref:hypothetical protein n=1 Tax=Rickettsiella endosymbiont of Xylota segnis TaxID=3066238 RepID=UPI0030CEC6E7
MNNNNRFEQLAYLEGYKRGFHIGFEEGQRNKTLYLVKNFLKNKLHLSCLKFVLGFLNKNFRRQ